MRIIETGYLDVQIMKEVLFLVFEKLVFQSNSTSLSKVSLLYLGKIFQVGQRESHYLYHFLPFLLPAMSHRTIKYS